MSFPVAEMAGKMSAKIMRVNMGKYDKETAEAIRKGISAPFPCIETKLY